MTNGGLLTTRSKRSAATGSKRLPRRRSSRTAVHRGVERRQPQAPLTDVGAHDGLRGAGRGGTPAPRTRYPGRGRDSTVGRTVHCASIVDAPPTPSTWSDRRWAGRCAGRTSQMPRTSRGRRRRTVRARREPGPRRRPPRPGPAAHRGRRRGRWSPPSRRRDRRVRSRRTTVASGESSSDRCRSAGTISSRSSASAAT